MSGPGDLDRYLDEFGRDLGRAAGAGRQRPTRRVLAAAVPALLVVLVLGVLAAGGDELDPVAEARAALGAPGEIVYLRLHTEVHREGVESNGHPPTVEQWSTIDPTRWRMVQTPHPDALGGLADEHGRIDGPTVIGYSPDELRFYVPSRETLEVQQDFLAGGGTVPGLLAAPGVDGADPATALRELLDEGRIEDLGERTVDGRTIRRLVTRQHLSDATIINAYDVDPDTFAPVRLTRTYGGDGGASPAAFDIVVVVDAYRRIPLDDSTEHLLRIDTTPQTEVTVTTAEEREAARREFLEKCRPRDGERFGTCPAPTHAG